jgi:hypothetical protein
VAVAWLSEIEERDPEGNALCTGRFECEGVELPFREALAWARAHADRAYIDIEFERYLLIGEDGQTPQLPPELAERVARGPRRPAVDAWRDRADDAPPARWEVEVALSPPDLSDKAHAEYERVVERVAGRLAAAGLDEIVVSSDEFDAGLADIEAQRRRAGSPTEFGWMTMHRLDFVLRAAVAAPSYRPVHARVRAAVLAEVEAAAGRRPYERGAEDIEDRWGVEVDVRPPGYEWRAPLL